MALAALIIPMIPGVIWLWIIYRTDWYEPEPKRLVLGTFALGVVAIVPAFVGARAAGLANPSLEQTEHATAIGAPQPPLPILIGSFLVIGPCEELAKFLAVRLFVFRSREFNEPLDG